MTDIILISVCITTLVSSVPVNTSFRLRCHVWNENLLEGSEAPRYVDFSSPNEE